MSWFYFKQQYNNFIYYRDICKDLSVKVDKLPIDKSDPSVSEYERHFKKVRK